MLEAVPAGAYEMSALLSLLRVEASAEVATAAVSCEARPVLRVNPAFVERHCRTDEHLAMLVLHELYHVLLGHTRLFHAADPGPQPGLRRGHQLAAVRALPGAGLHLFLPGLLRRPAQTGYGC